MAKDMTQGNLTKALVLFTVPLVLSGLFQQLFNWVDAFIVGNVDGELSLAAIGATSSIYHLFVTIITGFTSGLSILSAQQVGTSDLRKLKGILSTFSVLLGAAFLVIAAIGVGCTSAILTALDTPDLLYDVAGQYLRIMMVGIPFLAVYNVYSAVLRGLGDSRAPFWSILVSSLANVVLDILLVAGLGYGAAGAALATVISQAAMTVFVVAYTMRHYPHLRFRLGEGAVDRAVFAKGLRYGLPPSVQGGASAVGNIVLQRFMNGFGEQTVAAITTAYRVDSVLFLPIINFGSGIATVVAQNAGAGNDERAERALRTGVLLMLLISLGLTGLVLGTGRYLLSMFGLSVESVAIGQSFFRAIAGFYVVYGLATAFRGYLEGMGDLVFSGVAGMASLVVRIVLSYVLAGAWGDVIVAYAEAFSWIALLILYIIRLLARRKGKPPRR